MEKKAKSKEITKEKAKAKVEAKVNTPAKIKKPAVLIEKKDESVGLHNLRAPRGAHKGKRILGRGPSSGHGKTSTRGSKGQTSRAGRDMYLGFEGGQTPLIRRIPKRGFTSVFKKEFQIVNLRDLKRIKEKVINPEILKTEGLIKDKNKFVKILGDGEIKEPINIQSHAFSKKAQEKIISAGGKIEVLNV